MNRQILLVISVNFILLLSAVAQTQPDIKQQLLKLGEMSDQLLHVKGSWICWAYDETPKSNDAANKKLSQRASFEASGNFVNEEKSQLYIRLAPRISEWENGAAPFSETTQYFFSSGDFWIEGIESMGPEGQAFPLREAKVSAERPDGLSPQLLEIGAKLFPINVKMLGKENVVQLIQKSDPRITLTSEKDDTWRLSYVDQIEKPNIREQLVFKFIEGGLFLSERIEEFGLGGDPKNVLKYEFKAEPGKNIKGWIFPRSGTWSLSKTGNKFLEYNYSWDEVNEVQRDAPELQIPTFSAGWKVADKRIGTTFVVGEAPENVLKKIQESKQP